MRCIKFFLLCALFFWDASAFAEGALTGAASSGSGLPAGGSIADCVLNTAPGQGSWQACPGAAGGDSVSVDGAAVVDPNFASTGDVDFVNTSNTITANINANSVALGTDTTGNYAAGDAEAGAALTGDSATSFFSSGTIEDARLPSSMANKVFTGSILLPNGTAVPGTCSIGMLYFDNDATAGVNLYGCTASNTWTLLGDGGGGSGDVTAAVAFGTDNVLIRSDGTGKGVQLTGISVADTTYDISGAASIQFGSNPGDAGRVRLSNNESICWEAATPGTDLCLTLNASDEFTLNAPLNLTGTAGATLLTGVASPSAPGTAEQWYFYADSVDDLPKYIYNGGSEQTFFTTANLQTTAATASADDNDTSIATTAYVQTELTNYAADTKTLTNTTISSEGTGNSVTIKKYKYIPGAGCNNATAGSVWDLPTSNPAVAACRTGTNTQKGVLEFADGANALTAQYHEYLNEDWTGAIDATILYEANSISTNNTVWQIAIACVADGESDDPAFTDDEFTADAGKATAYLLNATAPNTVTTTGTCAAGEMMHVRLKRDPAHASDTLAATAMFVGLSLKLREAQ